MSSKDSQRRQQKVNVISTVCDKKGVWMFSGEAEEGGRVGERDELFDVFQSCKEERDNTCAWWQIKLKERLVSVWCRGKV